MTLVLEYEDLRLVKPGLFSPCGKGRRTGWSWDTRSGTELWRSSLAAAAGGREGWDRLGECSICHFCKYEGNCCPVIAVQYFAGISIFSLWDHGYRQDWAGGKTVLPHTLACFSRQLHALIMPRADPNAVLSSRCKLV